MFVLALVAEEMRTTQYALASVVIRKRDHHTGRSS
jgi:hypothetical protein